MSLRILSFALVTAAAMLIFAAERSEYAGGRFTPSIILCAGSVSALILLAIAAVRYLRRGFMIDQIVLAVCVAIFPYFVSDLLSKLGTPLNPHGIAIFGFALYGALSQLLALVMVIYLAVRGLRS